MCSSSDEEAWVILRGVDRERDSAERPDRLGLAKTATAAGSSCAPDGPTGTVGSMLGRYRLEGELGSGANGVVYAAFDPLLERRVALKLLRVVTPSEIEKDRLLREARAMARLSHAHVVTVHEVGTVGGRDFVVMELIHGSSLATWLRASARPTAAVLDAFLAAGRGLAAAHAAGIVHRDFKPHNVLRGHDGRIMVTDFGLARSVEPALVADRDAGYADGDDDDDMSELSQSRLTATGVLLGTPAYMAPEQWTRGEITAATDQFSFCVALWEALCGERPYYGHSVDELRTRILRGPAKLDCSRLPRGLRGTLLRGLAPEPARRWPSMDALLAQLERVRRRVSVRRGLAGAAIGAMVVTAGVWMMVTARNDADAPALCQPPARDVAMVWSPALASAVRATSPALADALDAANHDWQDARDDACRAPITVRSTQLACLDGALDRFDVLRRAYQRVPSAPVEELKAQMVDVAICRKPSVAEVPRLQLAPTDDVVRAYELSARSKIEPAPTDAALAQLADAATTSPCARIIATLALEELGPTSQRARVEDAVSALDQCGDDRVRAEALIAHAPYQFELPMLGPHGQHAIQQADNAVARVMQPDLDARIAHLQLLPAINQGQWDKAFRLSNRELTGYAMNGLERRQAAAVYMQQRLRVKRATHDDLEAVLHDVAIWRPRAQKLHQPEIARQLDGIAANAQLALGDVAAGHAAMLQAWKEQPAIARPGTIAVHGVVVDDQGHPVAGALVASSSQLIADSIAIGLPRLLDFNGMRDETLRVTTTDARGQFTIADSTPSGAISAQLGDQRAAPVLIADRVTLVLEPTRTVQGTIDLHGTPPAYVHLIISGLAERYAHVDPVASDGSFTLTGVATHALQLDMWVRGTLESDLTVVSQPVPASHQPITGLRLEVTRSNRSLDVLVHSAVDTPISGAWIRIIPGTHEIKTFGELSKYTANIQHATPTPITPHQVSGALVSKVLTGDLAVHLDNVRVGALTVCGGSFGNLLDTRFVRVDDRAVHCASVGADATLVELALQPQPRIN
jgi:predicted Ser/Thr protein kinase